MTPIRAWSAVQRFPMHHLHCLRVEGTIESGNPFSTKYPPVNKQLDPENHQFLMETSLPTPMTARVYVNLPEGSAVRTIAEK